MASRQLYTSIRRAGFGLPSARRMPPAMMVSPALRAYGAAAGLDRNVVEERVLQVISSFSKVDQKKVTREAHFANDLGLDSLDAVEVVMAIEEEFGVEIPDADADKIHSTADAISYILSNPAAK